MLLSEAASHVCRTCARAPLPRTPSRRLRPRRAARRLPRAPARALVARRDPRSTPGIARLEALRHGRGARLAGPLRRGDRDAAVHVGPRDPDAGRLEGGPVLHADRAARGPRRSVGDRGRVAAAEERELQPEVRHLVRRLRRAAGRPADLPRRDLGAREARQPHHAARLDRARRASRGRARAAGGRRHRGGHLRRAGAPGRPHRAVGRAHPADRVHPPRPRAAADLDGAHPHGLAPRHLDHLRRRRDGRAAQRAQRGPLHRRHRHRRRARARAPTDRPSSSSRSRAPTSSATPTTT